jgi:hypothetical protein
MTLFNGAFNLGNCVVVLLGVLAERAGYPAVFALVERQPMCCSNNASVRCSASSAEGLSYAAPTSRLKPWPAG